MSKSWEHSGLIERDNNDQRAIGALAYFYLGGTTTALPVYQDADESTPHEHPVEADGNGRWPAVYIPFTTSYDVKVTTAGGTQLYYHVEIPNPDPVEQAASGADPEELIATGHVHWEPVNTTKVGFVRLGGRTLGNAASGATERANADTADLFAYLWNGLANGQASVSAGRGASAAADYAANKTITLLDGRSGVLRGVDDMGNSAASRLGSAPFANGAATTAGSVLGENTHVLLTAEHAAHTHTFSATSSSDGAHVHSVTDPQHAHAAGGGSNFLLTAGGAAQSGTGIGGQGATTANAATGISIVSNGAHTHTVSGTSGSQGSATAHNVVSYGLLGTFFQKL